VDEYILQFKVEASQTDLGDTTLIEYLKAGLNPALFKSIYWLLVMPETLKEWYEWAQNVTEHFMEGLPPHPYKDALFDYVIVAIHLLSFTLHSCL